MAKLKSSLLIICLIQGMAQWCWADCNSGGLLIWPPGNTLVPNQHIMIEGSGLEREVARSVGKDYIACLVNDSEQIELMVVEICEGQWGVSQAVLRPKTMLHLGKAYSLLIEEVHTDLDYRKKYPKLAKWTVEGEPDWEAPRWTAAPKEIGKHLEFFGCGDDVWVRFKIKSDEPSHLRIRTQVKGTEATQWATYYLPVIDGRIDIGHRMCWGEFHLDIYSRFEAKFALVDIGGNVTAFKGAPILFTPPRELTLD